MIYFLILGAAFARFVPHLPNFAPVTAIAIFAGIYLPKKQAVVLPLAVRLVSDFFLGFFSWPLLIAVYLSHLFGVVLGLWIREHKTIPRVLLAPFFSAAVFFLVTNFAFLYSNYPHDFSGIIMAYVNGLPFLRGTFLGDFIYTIGLVGCYEGIFYLHRSFKKKQEVF